MILSVAEPVYAFLRYDAYISTGFYATTMDLIMGSILVFLVLEGTRRMSGAALPILSICFLLYGMFGRYIPGLFRHRGYSWDKIIKYLTCGTNGIYGSTIKASCSTTWPARWPAAAGAGPPRWALSPPACWA